LKCVSQYVLKNLHRLSSHLFNSRILCNKLKYFDMFMNLFPIYLQVCHDLDGISRLKFLKSFQKLLSSSEESKYNDLRSCLYSTRTLYIDLWCSLLEVKKNLSQFGEQWLWKYNLSFYFHFICVLGAELKFENEVHHNS